MAENILEVENIYSGYSDVDILKGVSFSVKEGEITCIIGPNGAGKSTLLKTIFGVLKIRRGRISYRGEDITRLSYVKRLKRGIVYLPQGRNVFPVMTVQENLEIGAYIRNDDRVKRDIEELYKKYPILRERKDQLAGSLSGGEQQILEMARGLLLHPKLMLLDEPTAGLSPKHFNEVFREIQRLNSEGVTIILVEQNAKRALEISDHAIVLEMGRKRFEGTGEEIMNNEQVKRLYLGG